ncbi:Rho GTPase-activating protein 25 [Balamuthia mandrillaris]
MEVEDVVIQRRRAAFLAPGGHKRSSKSMPNISWERHSMAASSSSSKENEKGDPRKPLQHLDEEGVIASSSSVPFQLKKVDTKDREEDQHQTPTTMTVTFEERKTTSKSVPASTSPSPSLSSELDMKEEPKEDSSKRRKERRKSTSYVYATFRKTTSLFTANSNVSNKDAHSITEEAEGEALMVAAATAAKREKRERKGEHNGKRKTAEGGGGRKLLSLREKDYRKNLLPPDVRFRNERSKRGEENEQQHVFTATTSFIGKDLEAFLSPRSPTSSSSSSLTFIHHLHQLPPHSHHKNLSGGGSTKLFGTSLDRLMRLQQETHPQLEIPLVLQLLIHQFFKMDGHRTHGIFRIPGNNEVEKRVRKELNRHNYDCFERVEGVTIYVVANTLKTWLRELPEPLISPKFYEQCVELAKLSIVSSSSSSSSSTSFGSSIPASPLPSIASSLTSSILASSSSPCLRHNVNTTSTTTTTIASTSSAEQLSHTAFGVRESERMLRLLPETNRKVIAYLLDFLKTISMPKYAQVTQMGASNLATAFAPLFLRCPDTTRLLLNAPLEVKFMQNLIVGSIPFSPNLPPSSSSSSALHSASSSSPITNFITLPVAATPLEEDGVHPEIDPQLRNDDHHHHHHSDDAHPSSSSSS